MAEGKAGLLENGQRETPREGESPRPRPPFTPSRLMLDDRRRASAAKNATIAVLLASLVLVWLTVAAAAREQRVIVIDPIGGVTHGPLEPLASSKGFFSITSINAVQAALQRSSVGFDLHELLPVYFSSRARRVLEEDMKQRWEDMRRRRLTLKPVVDSITPPQEAAETRVVKVTGRLQTTGVANGRVFYEEPAFELIFVYRPNPDLSNKASMPWLVDEIELATTLEAIAALRAKARPKP